MIKGHFDTKLFTPPQQENICVTRDIFYEQCVSSSTVRRKAFIFTHTSAWVWIVLHLHEAAMLGTGNDVSALEY